ncbi:uncharacterized protein LOC132783580 [Drosophila nasuta]|uniref:uncharacterized protein LOC132783580 n=1 Tax=Drosophila nasuta TaxID=42062 RepID=UPI00295ED1FE|nr:uncharacterized protein LOC132783580 [Drosophila nasuta]
MKKEMANQTYSLIVETLIIWLLIVVLLMLRNLYCTLLHNKLFGIKKKKPTLSETTATTLTTTTTIAASKKRRKSDVTAVQIVTPTQLQSCLPMGNTQNQNRSALTSSALEKSPATSGSLVRLPVVAELGENHGGNGGTGQQ